MHTRLNKIPGEARNLPPADMQKDIYSLVETDHYRHRFGLHMGTHQPTNNANSWSSTEIRNLLLYLFGACSLVHDRELYETRYGKFTM